MVPSEYTRQLLVRSGIDASRVEWSRTGVDTDFFAPAKRSAELRQRWRVSDCRPAIAYVGSIGREQGVALLPHVRMALLRRGVDHRFIIIGDGPMRESLQRQLSGEVFTGTLTAQDVAVALASSDVLVFPSETDSTGNAVLEAQASGLPVLVSDRGGSQEYIMPGRTGQRCFAGDAEGFACHAAFLLQDSRRRREMSAAARAHALTLRWDSAVVRLYLGYTESVARRAADGGAAARPLPGITA